MARSKKDPSERVRVKLPSGGETTLSRAGAKRMKYPVLEGKPISRHGRALGFKHKTSLPPAGAPEGESKSTTGGDATTS